MVEEQLVKVLTEDACFEQRPRTWGRNANPYSAIFVDPINDATRIRGQFNGSAISRIELELNLEDVLSLDLLIAFESQKVIGF